MSFEPIHWVNVFSLIFGLIKNLDFKLYIYKHINIYK